MKKYKSNRFNYEWTGYKGIRYKRRKRNRINIRIYEKYKINLGLLDEENFLIDNMGEIKMPLNIKYIISMDLLTYYYT